MTPCDRAYREMSGSQALKNSGIVQTQPHTPVLIWVRPKQVLCDKLQEYAVAEASRHPEG